MVGMIRITPIRPAPLGSQQPAGVAVRLPVKCLHARPRHSSPAQAVCYLHTSGQVQKWVRSQGAGQRSRRTSAGMDRLVQVRRTCFQSGGTGGFVCVEGANAGGGCRLGDLSAPWASSKCTRPGLAALLLVDRKVFTIGTARASMAKSNGPLRKRRFVLAGLLPFPRDDTFVLLD